MCVVYSGVMNGWPIVGRVCWKDFDGMSNRHQITSEVLVQQRSVI